MKHKFIARCVSLTLVLVFLLGTQSTAFAQKPTPPPPDATVKEKIDFLLTQYNNTVKEEMNKGQTKKNESGLVVLTGESESKVDALWEDTFRQIDELTARPIEERTKAIKNLQTIENTEKMKYSFHTEMPYYGKSVEAEIYESENYRYVIDVATGCILEIMIIGPGKHPAPASYSQNELESKAAEFLQTVNSNIDVSNLTLQIREKLDTVFFRWEDLSSGLANGTYPFVQVGLSTGGDLRTYVNTLPFGTSTDPLSISSLPIFYSATGVLMPASTTVWMETYANGGSYWSATGTYYKASGGYCSLWPDYCPGTFTDKGKYYYKSTVTGTTGVVKGTWGPNINSVVEAQAFIPCYNATHPSAKYELFTGSSILNYYVDQSYYCDAYALINDVPLNTIKLITLRNKASSTSYQVAWDEVQVWSDDSW